MLHGLLLMVFTVLSGNSAIAADLQLGYASQAKGVKAESLYTVDGNETIGVFNGNLALNIPIGPSYPLDGGNSYQISMHYNANGWEPVPATSGPFGACQIPDFTAWRPDHWNNAGFGWTISFGRLLQSQPGVPTAELFIESSGDSGFWAYEAPDGARYQFKSSSANYSGEHRLSTNRRLRLIEKTPGLRMDIEFPDGSLHEFTNFGDTDQPRWRATKIYYGHREFENFISIDYQNDNHRWLITDSFGRQHQLKFKLPAAAHPGDFSLLDEIVMAGHNGAPLSYKFIASSAVIPMHRGQTSLQSGPAACQPDATIRTNKPTGWYELAWDYQVNFLQRIEMPEGMFYQFYYYDSDFDFADGRGKSGALQQLRYPSGLRSHYNYTLADRTIGLPEDYQYPDPVTAGHYVFQFNHNASNFEFYANNTQSGINKKRNFSLDESTAINWSDPFAAPALTGATHYQEQVYKPSLAGYMAQPDQERLINKFRPCYQKRVVIDHLGRRTESFYNNVAYNNNSPSGRSGLPFTMCDPFLEHSIDRLELGVKNFFGKGVAGFQMPPNAAQHRYSTDGSGPFLSKLIRSADGRVLRSEWVRIASLGNPAAPADSHTVTLLEETRYHGHTPDDPGCQFETSDTFSDKISYDCFPVIAWKQTAKKNYDGFGHFGRTENKAQRYVDGQWQNWGDGNPAQTNFMRWTTADYALTSPQQNFYTFYAADCTSESGCPVFQGTPPTFNDNTQWWQLDAQIRADLGSTGTGQATTEYCHDDLTGVVTGTRQWAGTSRGPYDLYTRNLLEEDGSVRTGNIASTTVYGGDQGALAVNEACPVPSEPFVSRQNFAYKFGIPASSETVDCDDKVITQSAEQFVDYHTGWINRSADPIGVEIHYSYDSLGRLKTSRVGNKAVTEYRYSHPRWNGGILIQPLQLQTYICAQSPGCNVNSALSFSEVTFDARGLEVQTRSLRETDGQFAYRFSEYDRFGRRIRQSTSSGLSNSNSASYFEFAYDDLDRLISTTNPDSSIIIKLYTDEGDWLTATSGMVAMAQGSEEVIHLQSYDAFGRIIKSAEALEGGAGDVAQVISTYSYDHFDNLTHVCVNDNDLDSDATSCAMGQQRRNQYDGRSFLTRAWHPEIHVNGYSTSDNNDAVRYTYDGAGRMLSKDVPGNDFDLQYSYDPAGRLTQIRELRGAQRPLSEFAYAPQNIGNSKSRYRLYQTKQHHWVALAAGGIPEPVTVTETFAYNDPEGLFTDYTIQTSLGSRFHSSINSYDQLANITSIDHAACSGQCTSQPFTLNYHYRNGLLTEVPGYVNDIDYHPDGSIASITHSNGVKDEYLKDDFNWRLNKIQADDINWSHGPIAYDGSGNITAINNDYYHYDGLSRLRYGEVTAYTGQQFQQHASFDVFGNITSLKHGPVSASVEQLTGPNISVSSQTNRLTSAGANYDEAGNLTQLLFSNDTFQYGYDALGRMIHLNEADSSVEYSYLYSTSGERIAVLHLHDDRIEWSPRSSLKTVQRKYSSNLALTQWSHDKDYVYMGSQQVASVTSDGSIHHFHLDHLGSTRRISYADNQNLAQLQLENDYYPFGGYVLEANDEESIQFTGHERDAVSQSNRDADLDYMHARYYTSTYGRMLTADPVLGGVGASQSWNRYAYASNKPISRIDKNGKVDEETTVTVLVENKVQTTDPELRRPNTVRGTQKKFDNKVRDDGFVDFEKGARATNPNQTNIYMEEGFAKLLTGAGDDVTPQQLGNMVDDETGRLVNGLNNIVNNGTTEVVSVETEVRAPSNNDSGVGRRFDGVATVRRAGGTASQGLIRKAISSIGKKLVGAVGELAFADSTSLDPHEALMQRHDLPEGSVSPGAFFEEITVTAKDPCPACRINAFSF